MNPQKDCLHFNGYKPCGLNSDCNSSCSSYKQRGPQVLLIHLGALGAVVRSTALIKAIHRKYTGCQITWVTDAPAHHLLKNHPDIYRVFTVGPKDILELSCLKFDVALVIDKSLAASGVLNFVKVDQVLGFRADAYGTIGPATSSAEELWQIGLNDQLKFFENKKTEIQLITEALELDYQKDDYHLPLLSAERTLQFERWHAWSENGKHQLIGINTGCASTIAAKKLSVQNHRELIRKIQKNFHNVKIVLLGGPEDAVRNEQIGEDLSVIQSPTNLGLRDGLISIASCDLVITGDSLGMHMAISQKKPVIAWFGPTCSVEIELYGRGEKVLSKALVGRAPCGPCWKRSCQKPVMCYDLVELDEILNAADRYLKNKNESRDSDGLSGRSVADDSTSALG